MRTKTLILGCIGSLGLSAAVLAPLASSADSIAGATTAATGCEIPAREVLTPTNTRDGIPAWASWRASDAAQVALSQLAQAVDLRFGDTDKDSWIQLRNGYVGIAPNDEDHVVYVVVDLPADERAALEKELQAAAGDAIDVRASQSCHSAAALAAAADELSSGALAPVFHEAGGDVVVV